MKAQTLIQQSVKAAYDAYSDYCRKVDNFPVIPNFPKVSWVRGSLKNPDTGWLVDGALYHGTAEDVIAHWDKVRDRWIMKTRRSLEKQVRSAVIDEYADDMEVASSD